MPQPPVDPFDPSPARSPGVDPPPVADTGDSNLFAQLIRLVTLRAEEVGAAGPTDGGPMEDLREAVEALDHYLDAAAVVRTAFSVPVDRPEPGNPDGPKRRRATIPAAWADPETPDEDSAATSATPVDSAFPPFRDQVTGLHTRAGFDVVAGGELKRCTRHARPFSLVTLQLSAAAAEELRSAGMTAHGGLRASDSVGTEPPGVLLIGMPETSIEAAREVARRLVTDLQGRRIWDDMCRAGLSTRTADGDSLEGLIAAAHTRLELPTE